MCSISHSVSVNIIESNVIAGLKASVFSPDLKYKIDTKTRLDFQQDDLLLLRQQYQKLSTKEQRIQKAYEKGIDTLDEYAEKKARIAEEKQALEKNIRTLTFCQNPCDYQLEKIYNLHSAAELLSRPDIDYEKKALFSAVW